MKSVYYNNQEYQQLLDHFEQLTAEMEDSPFPQVKELLTRLLKYLDLIHREPLARLFNMIEEDHPEWISQIEADYALKTLFTLYDLMEGDIERTPERNANTMGFVPVDEVKVLTPFKGDY